MVRMLAGEPASPESRDRGRDLRVMAQGCDGINLQKGPRSRQAFVASGLLEVRTSARLGCKPRSATA